MKKENKLSDLILSKLLSNNLIKDGDKVDNNLIFIVMLLLFFGLTMIYSATSYGHLGSSYNYLLKQMFYIVIISIGCFFVFKIPINFWYKHYKLIIGVSIILLLIVLFFGKQVGVTRRWINLGPFNIQPSELFKIAVIIYLAGFLTKRQGLGADISKIWYIGIVIFTGLFFIYLGGDLGSIVIIAVVVAIILFLGGLPIKWIMLIGGSAVILLPFMILSSSYRKQRLLTFLKPESDLYGSGYQIGHALFANAQGKIFGVGLGNSLERFYLPELHTDFIAAFIAEELGLLGICFLVIIYILLTFKCLKIGKKAKDLGLFFSSYIAMGVGVLFAVQSFCHLGINIGMLPNKGLTLPLISYGGSSMLVSLLAITLVLKIDYENRRKVRGFDL